MKQLFILILSLLFAGGTDAAEDCRSVRTEGKSLMKSDGQKLLIKGTNPGDWLNPESNN